MRKIWRKIKPKEIIKQVRINKQIKNPFVFLIDENSERIGNVPTEKALQIAEELELDLVEVNPKADPPVVRIMDYGQYKYEAEKKAHKQKIQQKKVEIKGIRLSVRISTHDFDFRVKQAEKFLLKGNKLKLELVLKGREKQHQKKAFEVVNEFINKLKENKDLNIEKEQDLTIQGGRFTIVLINKKNS